MTKCQLIQNGTQNLKFEKGKENPMNILRKAAKIGSAAVILAGLLGIGSLSCAVCFAQSGGEAVYKAKCGMCHGADGLGATPTGKAMGVKAVSDPYITSLTEKQMFNSVKNGKERMPSFKNRLTDEQIRDAVAFYRELGGASSEPMPQAQDQGAQDQGDPMAAVAGEYVFEQSGIHYVFLPDGSCTTHGPGGVPTQCHFIVEGDWIRTTVKINGSNYPGLNFKKQGDKLYMGGIIMPAMELVRQGVPPTPDETVAVAPPAPITPAPPKYQALAPPPPPPPPAPTISMGQTKAQVTTAFGEPQRKAAAGPKEIFFYTDLKMKVTFTNGKVSGIE